MKIAGQHVDLRGTGFPDTLRTLREARHLSQSELADLAGLTYRTVHDLELGKRGRVQQKTLFMLANALEVGLDDLISRDSGPEPALGSSTSGSSRRPGRPWRLVLAIVVPAVLVAGWMWASQFGHEHARWAVEDGTLEVRDGLFGHKLWGWNESGAVSGGWESPWDRNLLLVTTTRMAQGRGQVICVEKATGDTLWAVSPDIPALVRAFGEEDVLSAEFGCKIIGSVDLDGDGRPAVLAYFTHGKYYPTALAVIDEAGRRVSQYSHRGHLFDILIHDLDSDGKDEIIASGTNNCPDHRGATVLILDEGHSGGASADRWCTLGPEAEQDSALARVVLPGYPEPIMEALQISRLGAFEIQVFQNSGQDCLITVEVGGHDPMQRIFVTFGSDLTPLYAEPKDRLVEIAPALFPDLPPEDRGPADREWLTRWLAGYRRIPSEP
ncbi:helix-turn-helix domain-containing protein [bacterium]|nr:helix-turn-helix domain-containing protein [bacterium]